MIVAFLEGDTVKSLRKNTKISLDTLEGQYLDFINDEEGIKKELSKELENLKKDGSIKMSVFKKELNRRRRLTFSDFLVRFKNFKPTEVIVYKL